MADILMPPNVVIIGAGRMGAGIAHSFLVAGCTVTLHDVTSSAVDAGRAAVTRSVGVAVDRGALAEHAAVALARLHTGVGIVPFPDAELVIEAVPEVLKLKTSVWTDLSAAAPPEAILASNTSSISISDLAACVESPERFLGMHFFNPVPVSKLVELVKGTQTLSGKAHKAAEWVKLIGKESILVDDVPGFATSRLGVAIGLEAIRMIEDGVASAEDIDKGMVLGYGFPMGPLKLTDTVGLDVRLEIAEYLSERLGERFKPPALLRKLVAGGRLGRKTGEGFYQW